MNTTTNNGSSAGPSIPQLGLTMALVLLLLHFYYYCYGLFDHWGWTTTITDRLLSHIASTGLFKNPGRSKLLGLVFMAIFCLGSAGRKDGRMTVKRALVWVLGGLMVYFGSWLVMGWSEDVSFAGGLYMLLTTTGFLLLLTGGTCLTRVLRLPWSADDPFGKRQAGFPQEQRKLSTKFGLYLRARYTWQGRVKDSWINLINPRRGILIMGSPGSGKSWFIIEPLIGQLMEKGFSLFVYDYKYNALTRLTWRLFLAHRECYPLGTAFYSINFSDLSRSHRCNVLHPDTLEWVSDAVGASRTILLSMNKSWIHKQGEFFVESPINFLAALIWYLRQHEGGIYCTLPHAIELAQTPYEFLFAILKKEPEIQNLVNPFIEAYENKTMEMLGGQVASAKIPLGRLASPDIYYVLTGNDFSLAINDPGAPKIFCLGGDPPRQEALGPVLSLYIDRLSRLCNRPGRYPCALVCDEFGTVRAYNMGTTIGTARSNDIVPILAVQDLTQLRLQYSKEEADMMLNISGNLLCGQVGGETARWVSERFPKILKEKTSVSTNSNDTSINQSTQLEATITPATVAGLSSGEFVGVVADDPGMEMELKGFHAKLVRERKDGLSGEGKLPIVRVVDREVVQKNFKQVKADIERLVGEKYAEVMEEGE
jgi:hypothetical protein